MGRSASDRVRRGGSFDNDGDDLRGANRDDDDPSDDDNIGFRCASSRFARRVAPTGSAPMHRVTSARRPVPAMPDKEHPAPLFGKPRAAGYPSLHPRVVHGAC